MVKVFTSSVINAHIDKVWMKIRDFNALPNWPPAIANSFIENGERSDQAVFVILISKKGALFARSYWLSAT
ncbi:MAG: hypothetical protein F6K18_15900 [Okeania sp. SIO2C2]|uniref:SRPBCC family protein n=1 Tax=Okeania sp. SIO2C2 TaxID=2607787 RepID=UPI0013BB3F3C|nr:hypothetical protein [Okeania sp. SIO2C2]NEP88194.1 hypothetical protein [Okeania sp. SIO2C2]